MPNPSTKNAIAKHVGIMPSQLRELSNNSYFVDLNLPIEDLVDVQRNIKVTFNQILIGNIAYVGPAVNA